MGGHNSKIFRKNHFRGAREKTKIYRPSLPDLWEGRRRSLILFLRGRFSKAFGYICENPIIHWNFSSPKRDKKRGFWHLNITTKVCTALFP